MKKFLIASNIVLIAAVAFLFYRSYQSVQPNSPEVSSHNTGDSIHGKIAYFDLDSLQNQYQYFIEVRDYLKGKDDANTKELNRLRNNYMSKLKEYNQKGPSLSQAEQGQYQQDLLQMQNDYQAKEQSVSQEMQAEAMEKMQGVKQKIQDFLKSYSQNKGYAYIFASNDNDYLYYKDTINNITKDIVVKLNDEYKSSKKK
ncbi:MAG: OmpH family outer membrane protein [Bacteroidetes bacterium]|nr:OmpH family outer membrane protein [Bacteroidota bacterium]